MLTEITDNLCRIGAKIPREQLFELSPVYLLSNHTDDLSYVQYQLSDIRLGLEDKKLLSDPSDVFLCFSTGFSSQEARFGLYDEAGKFQAGLDQWLTYISMKYHLERGMVLIHIDRFQENAKNHLWWKQFFSDIRKHKKHYLFFITFHRTDCPAIEHLFEKEVFVRRYDVNRFSAEEYLHWFREKLESYFIFLTEDGKTGLERLLSKYEADIRHQTLELWLRALLWNFYSREDGRAGLSSDDLSEELLLEIIRKCRKEEKPKIGFHE